MVSIRKAVGVLSCGFVLCFGLAYTAQAETAPASKIVVGEVSRIEDGNFFVKGKDGKEVKFHTDRTTQVIGQVGKGDSIEAKVNDKDHALLVRQTQ